MPKKAKMPERLFHYTSQSGLLGICSSKKIWATNLLYLNDRHEFSHATRMAQIILMRTLSNSDYMKLSLSQSYGSKFMCSTPDIGVFVTSFSEIGDLLSQWRGYCGAESGYSIGFDFSSLSEIAVANQMKFVKCIYDEEEQQKILKKIIDEVLEKNSLIDEETVDSVGEEIFKAVYLAASIFKDKAFEEEREWRVVSEVFSLKDYRTQFRTAKSTIVPFIDVSLNDTENCMGIKQIIVGPTPEENLGSLAVDKATLVL
ncbi:MAG: DUF2971 domain-containing protein [Desulfuromonadaceae bacterium]|nr:DUF2971 domain-containing protein [Desulfuromonadaceae bacterium]MDD2848514.1 DUF2971 domain-containing protein [Desulfuromonadaceae bacterium]MDD4129857.1 DUF2971 domain-containing protein [Desulfuromonadaceae bacterium]